MKKPKFKIGDTVLLDSELHSNHSSLKHFILGRVSSGQIITDGEKGEWCYRIKYHNPYIGKVSIVDMTEANLKEIK